MVTRVRTPGHGFVRAARLMAVAPDVLAIVKAVEWSATEDAEEGGYVPVCPLCGAEERSGAHAEGCRLAAALAKAEGRAP